MADCKGDYRLESFDEYDEPCEMTAVYCRQLTLEEYEEQSVTTTEQALLDLMSYMDKNPQAIQKLLQKRKKEDIDSMGFFSFLKMKMMGIINGNGDNGLHVGEKECQEKIQELQAEMTKVFDYSLKAKGRRCSSRLAAKRKMRNGVINDENNPALLGVPPPPPPPPPPALTTPSKTTNDLPRRAIRNTPLKDVNFQMDTPQSMLKVTKKRERRNSGESFSSLSTIGSFSSLQQELLSSNPLKRLRSTNNSRSPGGTPSRQLPGSKTLSEPLYRAFANTMQQKFRNVRSPSPAAGTLYDNVTSPGSAALSPSGFTP